MVVEKSASNKVYHLIDGDVTQGGNVVMYSWEFGRKRIYTTNLSRGTRGRDSTLSESTSIPGDDTSA